MKKIFITGGNGFIGSVVIKWLLQKGYEVKCLLRKTSDLSRLQSFSYEKALGDVRDYSSVVEGMKGCQAVIHLASLSNWNDINSPLMDDVVLNGTSNVLKAAKHSHQLPMVFVSSIAAINGSPKPAIFREESVCTLDLKKYRYSRVKSLAEEMCVSAADQKGLPVVIVNPAEVYGPYDTALNTAGNLIDFIKSSPVLVCKGGTSVVHVEDVALGIIAALERGRPGERYILGGDNLTVEELALLTLRLAGQKNKKIIQIPTALIQTAGAIASALHMPFPINPHVIPYATLYWFMDNAKARNELKINFRSAHQTLEPTIEWLKKEKLI